LSAVRLARQVALGCVLCAPAAVSAGSASGDKELGAYLSSECVACHQPSGLQVGGVPPIVGWPGDQFIAVMKAYRDGDRENPVMRNVVGRLSDEEIAALAAHFGEMGGASK
jgi:cytochrome c